MKKTESDEIIDRFIESWGSMGAFWGISRSVAKVHGLLIATDRPWTLDEIGERLSISKSNASTCMKELRVWGVVRKVSKPGDRKEYYSCEPKVWEMFFSIVRERKRREFDPILASVREAVESAGESPDGLALERLKELRKMLSTFDSAAGKVLATEKQARLLLSLLEGKG